MASKAGRPATSGSFKKGQPAKNPVGRPKGVRNPIYQALDDIATAESKSIILRAIADAKAGNTKAQEILLSRMWPVRAGGRPVLIDLPRIVTMEDVGVALDTIVQGMSDGRLTAEEGAQITTAVQAKVKFIETMDVMRRLEVLEKNAASGVDYDDEKHSR